METITIMEGNSRVVKTPSNTELFTPEIRELIEESTSKDYGTYNPEKNPLNLNFKNPKEPEKENFWTKYKVPIILGGSLVVIGLLYWLFFMRKK